MPALVDIHPGRTITPFLVDRHRSSFAVQPIGDRQAVVITAEIVRTDTDSLRAEVDGEFGICLLIRLTGAVPSIGLLRRSGDGFRELWRNLAPGARSLLRSVQNDVEHGVAVPVLWRTTEGFMRFQLGGWKREHRLWYCRLDSVDTPMEPAEIAFDDAPHELVPIADFIAT